MGKQKQIPKRFSILFKPQFRKKMAADWSFRKSEGVKKALWYIQSILFCGITREEEEKSIEEFNRTEHDPQAQASITKFFDGFHAEFNSLLKHTEEATRLQVVVSLFDWHGKEATEDGIKIEILFHKTAEKKPFYHHYLKIKSDGTVGIHCCGGGASFPDKERRAD